MIDNTLDPLTHMDNVEIQQIAESHAAELQIAQQLSTVQRQDSFGNLQLNNYKARDYNVYSVSGIQLYSIVHNLQRHLPIRL